ncbi:MAG TPA: outer membrane beta-barrel protein [Hyphomonadaceae bacterium]|nr:outer membrane beta-barrel protein [Hyphomonadaceae bacterium]
MKSATLLAAMAIGGATAAPALAQEQPPPEAGKTWTADNSGFYLGGGGNLYFLDRDYAAEGLPLVFEDQPSPGAWMVRLGYAFNQYIAVEVEAGVGAARSEFTTSVGAADGDIGLDSPLGAHLVLSMPLGGDSYVLGKAGYVSAKVSREYLGFSPPDLDLQGASFGAGAGFRSGPWDYRMEYSFMSGDSGDGGVLGIFVLHHF